MASEAACMYLCMCVCVYVCMYVCEMYVHMQGNKSGIRTEIPDMYAYSVFTGSHKYTDA